MIALWIDRRRAGVVHSVLQKFLGDLLSAKNFKFSRVKCLRGTILVGW